MIYIVFGVSGCGKSTVGKLLAESLRLPFYDADDFHPVANVAKMSKGVPLDDSDRQPWLESLATHIADWEAKGGAVLACSALKEKYRKTLASKTGDLIHWIYLKGDKSLIRQRIHARKDHYMRPELLDSQFAALEVPEHVLTVEISADPKLIVSLIIKNLA
jgi:carbohydrate kinase (thermoresistant glucokinase family)